MLVRSFSRTGVRRTPIPRKKRRSYLYKVKFILILRPPELPELIVLEDVIGGKTDQKQESLAFQTCKISDVNTWARKNAVA